MRGDILLFRAEPGSILDHLIAWRTGGPFVHVEVDLGDGTAIGALQPAVSRHPVNYTRTLAIPLLAYTDKERIEDGIAWLLTQVGEPYSYVDILDHLLPRWARVVFARRSGFDCSNLVARYLDITGGIVLPKHLDASPDLVAPMDIYNAWRATKPAQETTT